MSSESEKKQKTSKSRRETAVQGTNDNSIVSKCSMAAQGYFDDPFLPKFVTKVTRRAPLIHRGYYVRAKTLDFLVKKFLESYSGHKQIISLGAGFDSAYFRLSSQKLLGDTVYFEVDFPEVVKRKCALIKANDVLSQLIEDPVCGKDKSPLIELCSKRYNLLGVDLTQINTLEAVLKLCDVDFDVPTLLLSEIVLAYITRRCASAVVKWAAETFSDSVFILYEQINPNDAFGLFMQKHYNVIGSPLKCINAFPTIQSQINRFTKLGWKYFEALDMNQFYKELIPDEERARVEHLEPFDEYEEWHLKCNHYMMLCAYQNTGPHLLSHITCHSENIPDNNSEFEVYDSCIEISSTKSPTPFQRFGHVTTRLGSDWLLCVGGFGKQGGKHMRVTDITFINSSTLQIVNVDPQVNNREIEVSRMHSTACTLQDGTVLLIGGRVSPMRLCSQMVALMLNCGIPDPDLADVLQYSKSLQNGVKNYKQNNVDNLDNRHGSDWKKGKLKNCESGESGFENAEKCERPESAIQDINVPERQERPDSELNDFHFSSVCVSKNDNESFKSLEIAERPKIAERPIKENVEVNDNMFGCESRSVENLIPVVREMNCGESVDTDLRDKDKLQVKRECDELIDMSKDFSVKCSIVRQEGDLPCPRWRHTALLVKQNGVERIILFGGRTQDVFALGDCFSYDTATRIWTKVTGSGTPPTPRHSHTATFWNGHMIIAGGLGDNLQPLSSVYMLNLESFKWHKLDCKISPRYSHTACINEDLLVLIFGVSFAHTPLGVTVINLSTGSCMNFSLPAANKDDLMMLHRHTSVAIDHSRIIILGGGGNCFSFGTHLNSSPLLMDLTKAFQMINAKLDHC